MKTTVLRNLSGKGWDKRFNLLSSLLSKLIIAFWHPVPIYLQIKKYSVSIENHNYINKYICGESNSKFLSYQIHEMYLSVL